MKTSEYFDKKLIYLCGEKFLMKKIGLITYYKNNFGSMLQCYATQKILENYGYEVEVIDSYQGNISDKVSKLFRLIINSLKDMGYYKEWESMRQAMKKEKSHISLETQEKMNMFIEKELCPSQYKWSQLKKIAQDDEYICFVTGSDQVWNASREIKPIYFLSFAPRSKRIAFAVSLGVNDCSVPNFSSLKKGIYGFDSISVREESGYNMINEITHGSLKLVRIGDPVIMLAADEWKTFYSQHINIVDTNNSYIFAHFLNAPNETAITALNTISNKRKCKVIVFANHYAIIEKLNNYEYINGGPEDYLWLIDHACCVHTDSFHTTIFSMIFTKEFYTYPRQYLHGYSQEARLEDLLNRYNLMQRFIRTADDFDKALKNNIPDYSNVLTEEKNKTLDYLISSVQRNTH